MRDGSSLGYRARAWTASGRPPRGGDPFPRVTLLDLARRAVGAAHDAASAPAERAWVRSVLTGAELGLWEGQTAYDRSHSVRVARRLEQRLEATPHAGDTRWPAAALLHDVGKTTTALSMVERAAATLSRRAVGLARARTWAACPRGLRRRVGLYLTHGEIGAAMIRAAGGRDEIALWAEVHQTHPGGPAAGIPAAVADALLAADTG